MYETTPRHSINGDQPLGGVEMVRQAHPRISRLVGGLETKLPHKAEVERHTAMGSVIN
jgi:hypothetical protein